MRSGAVARRPHSGGGGGAASAVMRRLRPVPLASSIVKRDNKGSVARPHGPQVDTPVTPSRGPCRRRDGDRQRRRVPSNGVVGNKAGEQAPTLGGCGNALITRWRSQRPIAREGRGLGNSLSVAVTEGGGRVVRRLSHRVFDGNGRRGIRYGKRVGRSKGNPAAERLHTHLRPSGLDWRRGTRERVDGVNMKVVPMGGRPCGGTGRA